MTQPNHREDVLKRMAAGTDEGISPEAEVVRTNNDYWVAWFQGVGHVLPPDLADDQPSDRVEGCESLQELIGLIESGAYAQMKEFEGTDEEWDAMTSSRHEPHA